MFQVSLTRMGRVLAAVVSGAAVAALNAGHAFAGWRLP
jgi:heme A synthase